MIYLFFKLLSFSCLLWGAVPDWSENTKLNSPRFNIYQLNEAKFKQTITAGKKHALIYPVDVTGLLIPYEPLKYFFETDEQDPVRKYIFSKLQNKTQFYSIDDLLNWLGLHSYPETQEENPLDIPHVDPLHATHAMGTTLLKTKNGIGITFSCAACHSADLFGKKILGMTNRFPKANEFFHLGKQVSPFINSYLFQMGLKTTQGERLMIKKVKNTLPWVGTKKPQVLGLDTSLSQVALSLSKREQDEYASRTPQSALFPRHNTLEKKVADSKPAVWWNLKYKTRWLSDGSIVSGNPIFTNFLWNEIGRGTDLVELEKWLQDNQKTIEELTTAVFATEAPKYTQFFGEYSIDITKAKRGEILFQNSCTGCHGQYEKNWESSSQTTRVIYHQKTPVIDVGTDPMRYQGMQYFAQDLNRLKISKWMKTKVVPQKGYVPPPLVGIWARWPYLHNNSIPSLCALMTNPKDRPETYWAGPAIDENTDYDHECVGYPSEEKVPHAWRENPDYFYDTSKEGLSNQGHFYRIFTHEDGTEKFTQDQKRDLIEFLKTL